MRDRRGRYRRSMNRRIALERINILFNLAIHTFKEDPTLAQRYIELAKRIGMRYKVRVPHAYRWMICKYCKGLLLPGQTSRTRIQQRREPHVVITCLHCGRYNRIPFKNRVFRK